MPSSRDSTEAGAVPLLAAATESLRAQVGGLDAWTRLEVLASVKEQCAVLAAVLTAERAAAIKDLVDELGVDQASAQLGVPAARVFALMRTNQ